MASYHTRKSDHSLQLCRDSHGHPLEHCHLHGGGDIRADTLEDAYAQLNARDRQRGMKRDAMRPSQIIQGRLSSSNQSYPVIHGSAPFVVSLL